MNCYTVVYKIFRHYVHNYYLDKIKMLIKTDHKMDQNKNLRTSFSEKLIQTNSRVDQI